MTPTTHHCPQRPECMTLIQARCGDRLRIVGVQHDSPAALRLRELGFCESAEVCKVADRGACICLLMGTRVAIGANFAAHVLVERIRRP